MSLTDQQSLIISTFSQGHNTLVNASPGTGKTFVINESVKALPPTASVLALAFNKSIATTLQTKLSWNPNAKASTTHSDAYSFFPGRRPKVDSRKLQSLIKDLYPRMHPDLACILVKLVNSLKDQAIGIVTHPTPEIVLYLDEYYDLGLVSTIDDLTQAPDQDHDPDTLDTALSKTLRLLDTSTSSWTTIDFQDMLYIPVKHHMPFKPYDYVLCDEVQDFSPLQIAYLEYRATSSIVLLVGDKKQSAYAFRGADSEAFPRLKSTFSCIELPMNKTFRCPISICDEANTIFPDAMIPMSTKPGLVSRIDPHDLASTPWSYLDQDSILMCRTNAPLFLLATTLLRNGYPVRVQPKVVNSFLYLVKRQKASSLTQLLDRLETSETRDLTKARTNMGKAIIQDKYETIRHIASQSTSIKDVLDTLTALLTSSQGPLLTSIHSGKGLEASKAYIYRPDLLPHPMATKSWEREQERNLHFIAVTRALDSLFYV